MEYFGLMAGIVGVAGYVPYIRDILRRTTKPDRASWLIWAIEYTVLFFAQLAEGATSTLWLVGLQTVGVVVVCVLSFGYGMGSIDKRSMLLLACICIALVGWRATNNAAIALCIALAVEASGMVLTAIKAYQHPESETLTMWVLDIIAGALSIPAVGMHAPLILYVYPVSLIVMCGCVLAAVLLGSRRQTVSAVLVRVDEEDR